MKNKTKKCKFNFSLIILLLFSLIILLSLIHYKFISFFPIIKNKFNKYQNLLRIIEENPPENGEEVEGTDELEEEENDDESFNSDVNDICKKASKDIQNYFNNYDELALDLSSVSLMELDIYPDYIQALLDILSGDGKLTDNLFKYLSHAIAGAIFLILGIIAIFCWMCFGFFCCCNCCCCCCCKKPECKGKILFISLLFDFVIIFTCLYGLITSNTMFSSFEDVECTFMKFVSEIKIGENRNNETKWVGFTEILSLFTNLTNKVSELKSSSEEELIKVYNTHNEKKTAFKKSLEETYEELTDPDDPFSDIIFAPELCFYIIQENTINSLDVGALDILYDYGPVTNNEKFLYELNEKYDEITEKADIYLNSSYKSLTHIFEENSVDIFVDEIKKNVKVLRKSINKIKKAFVKYIIKYFDIVDSKGNYMVKICYIAVIGLAVLSGLSLFTMYSTAEECCYQKCCFGKGLTKTLSHFSWNLMSVVMILSFFICGVIFLISSVGKDLIEVISVILGQQNLFSRKPIVINSNSSNYFNVCIHGDGDLPEVLGIYSQEAALFEFDELNKIISDVNDAILDLETTESVISTFKNRIKETKNIKNVQIFDFNASIYMNLENMIETFNELISTEEYDMWTLDETCKDNKYIPVSCPEDINDIVRKDVSEEDVPKECLNFYDWKKGYEKRYKPPAVLVLDVTYNTVLKAAKYFVDAVNNITTHIKTSNTIKTLEEKINVVEKAYNESIEADLEALEIFNKTIYDMLSVFYKIGDESESLFSFLYCEFIGKNVLIIFKYLKKAFGGKVQAFGVTFVFASFAMFFSTFFTILEIVILNVSLYLQKRRREREEQLKIALEGEKIATFETTGTEKDRIMSRKSKKKY